MNYTLVRSKRKTVSIYITQDATVEVRAPLKLAKSEIDRIVLEKEDWIVKHLAIQQERCKGKEGFLLDYGSMVLYRGQEYRVISREGNRIGFDDSGFYLPPNLDPTNIKLAVIQLYKLLAKADITDRVNHFSKIMGLTPTAVKINSAKSRWGSCSGRNSLNFTWRLILADDDLINYVVVHELAHIKEHNHSSRFWDIVAEVIPDYKQQRKGLEELTRQPSVAFFS